MESIAAENGLNPRMLWQHGENDKLRRQRGDPHSLMPDDKIFLPDKQQHAESGATEQKHQFRRKGVPSKLKLRCVDEEGKPLDGWNYVLTYDGETVEGELDGSGGLEISFPPRIVSATLQLSNGEEEMEWPIDIGSLDPIEEIIGAQERLQNLGFGCDPTGELDEQTLEALNVFQISHNLSETDYLDDATLRCLKEIHDESEVGL